MKEFTIRGKRSVNPILTFTPSTYALLQTARPESIALVWGTLVTEYQRLTGKKLVLDYIQHAALLTKCNPEDNTPSYWKSIYSDVPPTIHHMIQSFVSGFRVINFTLESGSIEGKLAVAETFYTGVDLLLIANKHTH